jgi:hypothetical protein
MRKRSVALAGVFRHGEPLDRTTSDAVQLPPGVLEPGDEVYRVDDDGHPSLNVRRGDLLLVQPRRGRASAGKLVLAEAEGRAYLGRWRRDEFPGQGKLRVLGAVRLIARGH